MEVLYTRCEELDMHQRFMVACLSVIEAGQRRNGIRTSRCVTSDPVGLTPLARPRWIWHRRTGTR